MREYPCLSLSIERCSITDQNCINFIFLFFLAGCQRLTGRDLPRAEEVAEDVVSDDVGDEVEAERVPPVEQDALHQRNDIASRVVARAHDRHLDHLRGKRGRIRRGRIRSGRVLCGRVWRGRVRCKQVQCNRSARVSVPAD